jgi:hypothetical protein
MVLEPNVRVLAAHLRAVLTQAEASAAPPPPVEVPARLRRAG